MNVLACQLPPLRKEMLSGYCLNWREAGEGINVVFLHGISSCSASWVKQFSDHHLSERYHLLAWDAPGYLQSQPLLTLRPNAIDYAQVIKIWLDELGLSKVILVGHSLGAIMASAYAALYPDNVMGLALIDPAQGYANASSEKRQTIYRNRQKAMEELGVVAYAEQRAAALLSPSTTQENIDWVCQGMQRLNPQGFLAAAWMLAHEDIYHYLTQHHHPLMMMCGEEDTITPLEQVTCLAKQFGQTVKILPNAGHASYLDAASLFNRYLTDFIQQLS